MCCEEDTVGYAVGVPNDQAVEKALKASGYGYGWVMGSAQERIRPDLPTTTEMAVDRAIRRA